MIGCQQRISLSSFSSQRHTASLYQAITPESPESCAFQGAPLMRAPAPKGSTTTVRHVSITHAHHLPDAHEICTCTSGASCARCSCDVQCVVKYEVRYLCDIPCEVQCSCLCNTRCQDDMLCSISMAHETTQCVTGPDTSEPWAYYTISRHATGDH